jgi:hypothetical protein
MFSKLLVFSFAKKKVLGIFTYGAIFFMQTKRQHGLETQNIDTTHPQKLPCQPTPSIPK